MSEAATVEVLTEAPPIPPATEARARALQARYGGADTEAFLRAMLVDEFQGKIALVSSFGAEAAVLLHLVSTIDPATPVIFLDTKKLFGETLRYRDQLVERLGLADVRNVEPDPDRLRRFDADDVLWYGNPDMCCFLRKVEPLQRALEGFDASITGRKAAHGGERSALPRIEASDDGRIKVNPLADWDRAAVEAHFEAHDLPRHPLEADGFLSLGCMPCTDRVAPGEDARAGRWRGRGKTECGIHLPTRSWSTRRWTMLGID